MAVTAVPTRKHVMVELMQSENASSENPGDVELINEGIELQELQ